MEKTLLALVWLLLASGTPLSAQFSLWRYETGFIVDNAGDTLHGQIRYTTPALRSVKIFFRSPEYPKAVEYRPFNIRGFFVDEQYFESRIYDVHPSLSYGWAVFMERKNAGQGPIKIYEYWNPSRERGFTETFLVRGNGEAHPIRPGHFREDLLFFLADHEALCAEIERQKAGRGELESIVERYNAWYNSRF